MSPIPVWMKCTYRQFASSRAARGPCGKRTLFPGRRTGRGTLAFVLLISNSDGKCSGREGKQPYFRQ